MNQSRLEEYIGKLTDKYRSLPPVMYQIGYPGNYKDHDMKDQVKYNISKHQSFISNEGASLNTKNVPWVSSLETERDIILKLIAPWGGTEDNTWAYITSGGTEGNIAGFQIGLKAFYPHKPILVYSHEAHFSISKAIELTKTQFSIILQIPTLRNGEIDCRQIIQALRYVMVPNATPDKIPPVIVMATLGTTMKGACDDVCLILDSLISVGLTRDKIFVHLDAAFHGGFWELDKRNPNYQLGAEFNSIAISGWKWHGADICGLFAVYQTQESMYDKEGFREYIGISDFGVTSSRNGLNAISWMIRYLQFDWQEEYDNCQKNVKLVQNMFESLGIETFVNPASLIVCMPKLPEPILDKYCLACYNDDLHLGEMCHVVVCPHVTEHVIEMLVSDVKGCLVKVENCFKV